jgi:hypothetical protein
MFIFIDIKSAVRAYMTLVKPRLDAWNMEMMVAGEIEHLVASFIYL